jgi:3'-5' exoribonuclease
LTVEFTPNERFDRLFLLKNIEERLTRNGKPFLAVVLGSPAADMEARVWDMELKSLPGLTEGLPVRVRGTAQLYQEKLQLIVETIEKVHGPVDPREIYPSTSRPDGELRAEFLSRVDEIRDRSLSSLMAVMREDKAVFEAFFISPAATTMHHARIGGLAEHSLAVCRLAVGVADEVDFLDRDLLIAGSLLHDIGKIFEYEVDGDLRYTLDGKLVGHIARGGSILENWVRLLPGFPERLALELLHIILSHHGALEHGSPKVPSTAEALVIHFADDLDAKLDMIRSATPDPPGGEAFVRGLRRMFQYRGGEQGAGRGAQGEKEKGGEKTGAISLRSRASARPGSQEPESRGKGTGEEVPGKDETEDDQGELF